MENFLPKEAFEKLSNWANKISCDYYAPVFLFGSSLSKTDYNDVDVMVVLPNEYFRFKYGNDDQTRLKIARDTQKQWENGCRATGLNLHLKIFPQIAIDRVQPSIKKQRLDTTNF